MKRFQKLRIGQYEAVIRDYQYKIKPPVGVLVNGLRDGECINVFGKPCYFHKAGNAMSMEDGIMLAKTIISAQQSLETVNQ